MKELGVRWYSRSVALALECMSSVSVDAGDLGEEVYSIT